VVTNTVEVPFARVRHAEPFASLGSDEGGQWEGESFSEWLEENRRDKIGDLDMFPVPAFANPSILHPQPIYQLWIGKAIMSTGWWKLERGNRFTTSGMGSVAAILSDVRAALADLGIKQEPELCTFLDVG